MRFQTLSWRELMLVSLLFFAVVPGDAETKPPAADSPVLAIDGLGKGAAPLSGNWQFRLGDDPAWASQSWDDSGWEKLSADKPWGAQSHASYTGYAWYRRRVSLSPAPGASPDFAVLLGKVEDAYEIYWNGQLVGTGGALPPNPKWYYVEPPRTYGLGPARTGVIAFRVWKAPLTSFDTGVQGGFRAVPLIGSPDAIATAKASLDYQWLRRRQFTFGLDSLYGLVALVSFLAWLRERRQWLLFWMAGFSLGPIFNFFLLGLPTGLTFAWSIGLAQPVFGMTDISLWFLLLWLLQLHDNRKLVRLATIFAVLDISSTSLDGLLNIIPPSHGVEVPVQVADGVLTAIFTSLEALPIVLVAYAVFRRRRLDPARWLVAVFAFTTEMISVVRIASEQGSRYTHWTLFEKLSSPMFVVNGNAITPQTFSSTLLLISIIYAVYRFSVENSRRQATMEQEFKNARELQQVLVPENLPPLPGFALTSAYRPAQEVGGDFFQIVPMSDGATLVILGDVSGKGLKAAMAVSLIVGATRMIVEYTSSPSEILAALNRRLYGRMKDGFVTAIAMRMDATGACTLASAGHPAPFLNQHELDLVGALPLGLTPNAEYEEHCFKLQVGDHFALYTDGLLEARSQSGELYGFERLERLFGTRPNAAEATDAAVNFGQDDDITVLTLTRLATAEETSAIHSIPALAPA